MDAIVVVDWPRQTAALFLLIAAGLGALFYGTTVNLITLAGAGGTLIAAAWLLGPQRIAAGLARNPNGGILALAALAVIVVNCFTSLSPESTFVVAWVVAAIPASYLLVSAMTPAVRRRLALTAFGAIVCLAFLSAARFLLFGERAHLPLIDPNNYASLMYAAWIPWVHMHLIRRWRGAPARWFEWPVAFVLLVALIATQSRVGTIIAAVAVIVWIAIALVRRERVAPVLSHGSLLVAAYAIGMALAGGASLAIDGSGGIGSGIASRFALLGAAFEMFASRPMLGIGLMVFAHLYPSYRSLSEQGTAGLFVHNDFLQFLTEGGPLLAAVFVFWVVATIVALVRAVRAPVNSVGFANLGLLMALGALMAHASVNFVFYTMPLGIVAGALAAGANASAGEDASATVVKEIRGARLIVGTALALAVIAWGYLVLDVVIYGVFQGQATLPGVAHLRADKQLEFARFAQVLNSRRGLPILAEAAIVGQRVTTPDEAQATLAVYRRAVATDPWNPDAYVRMAAFVEQHEPLTTLNEGEDVESLLLRSIAVNPVWTPSIDALLAHYHRLGKHTHAREFLRRIVLPWSELIARQNKPAAQRYVRGLEQMADATDDRTLRAELAPIRAKIDTIVPLVGRGWFVDETSAAKSQ